MRNHENFSKELMTAVSGKEVRALIEKGITPLFLRGFGPCDEEERSREQTALSYGLRQVEGQGGIVVGDGLSHGSPILLGQYARRALKDSRATLEKAVNYRQTIQLQEEELLAQAQVTHHDAELPLGYGPEQPPHMGEQQAQLIEQQHELPQTEV